MPWFCLKKKKRKKETCEFRESNCTWKRRLTMEREESAHQSSRPDHLHPHPISCHSPTTPAKFTSHLGGMCVSGLESSTFELPLLLSRSEPSWSLCNFLSPSWVLGMLGYLKWSFPGDPLHTCCEHCPAGQVWSSKTPEFLERWNARAF